MITQQLVDIGSSSAEPFRSLRLALELRAASRRGNIVLFTSPEAREGKSTIASNFALVSSLSTKSVLLIDGDLREPSLHEIFGFPRSPGLVDLFATPKALKDRAYPVAGLGALSVLTAGAAFGRSGDLVSSPRMGEILKVAAAEYGMVVIDSPPLLSSADAPGLASHPGVDVVLVLSKQTRRRTVMRAVRKLELLDVNVLGMVVNREGTLSKYGY
ncbi:MAG: protein-tyrosine kinase [Gaiellaceae bacterium]|nr:protein-tyrosine kinase [Gaiellaceae bacterium]